MPSRPAKSLHLPRRPPGVAAPRVAAATATVPRLQARSPGQSCRVKRRNGARRNGGREAAALAGAAVAIGDLVAAAEAAAVTASPVAAEAESTATAAVAAEAAASIINVAVEAPAMIGTSAEVARPAVVAVTTAENGGTAVLHPVIGRLVATGPPVVAGVPTPTFPISDPA